MATRLTQGEFTDALQVSESEDESYGLLKRHLERSIPRSAVVVLNRNNSADRLEATTEVPSDSGLAERLATAQPRDCLAVRSAQRHDEEPGAEPLISCDLSSPPRRSDVVQPAPGGWGGDRVGPLAHGDPLSDEHRLRVKDSVTQAAPVLANLRNLAIAQLRAATDALTGLPNAARGPGHAQAAGGPGVPDALAARHGAAGPRPLQGHQRHVRPRDR